MADAKLTALPAASVPALADTLYGVAVGDTTDDPAGSSNQFILGRLGGLSATLPGGRLTTESGASVSTSDRTSQSTIYFTPHVSDYIRLYDGTRVREYAFSETNLALSGLTSGANYDIFGLDSSGSLALELSAAWTNSTTRADALAWQTGLGWVKSGTPTRLYLGTIRTTGTAATEDSKGKRFVWNAYNRVPRRLSKTDAATSWTYNSTTMRQANANSANQVEVVVGLADAMIALRLAVTVRTTTSQYSSVSIGRDSTTATSGFNTFVGEVAAAFVVTASLTDLVPLGYHYYTWLETSDSGTHTWYGGPNIGLMGHVSG